MCLVPCDVEVSLLFIGREEPHDARTTSPALTAPGQGTGYGVLQE